MARNNFGLSRGEIKEFIKIAKEKYKNTGLKLTTPWLNGKDWTPKFISADKVESYKKASAGTSEIAFPWIEMRGHNGQKVAGFAIKPTPKIELSRKDDGISYELDIRPKLQSELRKLLPDDDSFFIGSGGSTTSFTRNLIANGAVGWLLSFG